MSLKLLAFSAASLAVFQQPVLAEIFAEGRNRQVADTVETEKEIAMQKGVA